MAVYFFDCLHAFSPDHNDQADIPHHSMLSRHDACTPACANQMQRYKKKGTLERECPESYYIL